jgi:hypothetical protein
MLIGQTLILAVLVVGLRRFLNDTPHKPFGDDMHRLLVEALILAGNAPQDVTAALDELESRLPPTS